MPLQGYLDDTQSLLRDTLGLFTPQAQLIRWINQTRDEIAELTQCLNFLIAGQSPFGNQAQVGAAVAGAAISGTQPGAFPNGFQVTTTTFQTIPGTESYPFDYGNPYLAAQYEGVDRIVDVDTVAVSWGNLRRVLDWLPFAQFQAYCRVWAAPNFTYPWVFSTNGDGVNKRIWLFPPPSIANDMEWDVFALPKNLALPTASLPGYDLEALPDPFTLAIKFGAARLAYWNTRPAQAQVMETEFLARLGISRAASDRGKTPYYYR